MNESKEKLLYDKIANNIQGNIVKINEILSNCKIDSNFVSSESEVKKFFESETSSNNIIKNESTTEYYDSNSLTELFKMLESGNVLSQGHKPLAIARSVSLSSLGEIQ